MTIFNSNTVKVARNVLIAMLEAGNGRTTATAVAEALNVKFKTTNWDAATVMMMIDKGAFDDKGKREFGRFRGRFGGIREVDLTVNTNASKSKRTEKIRMFISPDELKAKRQENAAKAREAKAAKLLAEANKAAEIKAKRRANAAKAREVRMKNRAAA